MKDGKILEAIQLYTKAIDAAPYAYPEIVIFHSNRSVAHTKMKNYEAALLDASLAAHIDKSNVKAWARTIQSLLKISEVENQAYELIGFHLPQLEKLVSEDANYQRHYNNLIAEAKEKLANHQKFQGRMNNAAKRMEQALQDRIRNNVVHRPLKNLKDANIIPAEKDVQSIISEYFRSNNIGNNYKRVDVAEEGIGFDCHDNWGDHCTSLRPYDPFISLGGIKTIQGEYKWENSDDSDSKQPIYYITIISKLFASHVGAKQYYHATLDGHTSFFRLPASPFEDGEKLLSGYIQNANGKKYDREKFDTSIFISNDEDLCCATTMIGRYNNCWVKIMINFNDKNDKVVKLDSPPSPELFESFNRVTAFTRSIFSKALITANIFENNTPSPKCFNCNQPSQSKIFFCASCKMISLCSKECQKKCWKKHKKVCKIISAGKSIPKFDRKSAGLSGIQLRAKQQMDQQEMMMQNSKRYLNSPEMQEAYKKAGIHNSIKY